MTISAAIFSIPVSELTSIRSSQWKLFVLASDLQIEVENLAAKLRYMEDAKKDVRSDIAVMKRATDKAGVEVAKAEEEKKKQVCFMISGGWIVEGYPYY